MNQREARLGANYMGGGRCCFLVWAPNAQKVEVHLLGEQERLQPLRGIERGYYEETAEGVEPGTLYTYKLNGEKGLPDPASRLQSQGVHGPSQVVDSRFPWDDGHWFGMPLEKYIIYELHVGTYTEKGTFEAIIDRLEYLQELGITAIELMPVAQFPGERNWGYDGVFPFAVQNSYGGPQGLKKLVNACHGCGLAVVLDVVYNHLGPEGNYLGQFGPYFTERYRTPWGKALNFDGAWSDEVRRYFIENALYWVREFHVDALRLDAVHAIVDHSPRPFLEELAMEFHEEAKRLNRQIWLFPESAANDARLIRSPELGGYGMDAQWNDDFHHALHVLLTGQRHGYYMDYGGFQQLVKAFQEGFVYSGEYSEFRRQRHGTSSRDIPAQRFIVFAQNHDQVGNRMLGERMGQLISFEQVKLAAGLVLFSPFVPLLFMGEEYGELAPFQYFVSHSDRALVEAVRQGRKEEFAAFGWRGEPPDPQAEATFVRSKLNHALRNEGRHAVLLAFYKELLRLRRAVPALARLSKEGLEVRGYSRKRVLFVRRWSRADEVFGVFNLSETPSSVAHPIVPGHWAKLVDSADGKWQGQGSSLPEEFESEGEKILSIGENTFAWYERAVGYAELRQS